jgi:pyridoxal phosphate-dependent aminotransferase EpsN
MLLSDDLTLLARARYLATQARQPVPHYEHTEIGYNYRLSNLLAALGRGQLSDLDRRITRREQIYASYAAALDGVDGVEMMPIAGYGRPNYWLTCITIDPSTTGVDRETVRLRLEDEDIESRPTWKPMHRQPVFRDARAYVDGTSDRIFEHGLCLPSGSGMSDADQQRVIDVLLDALGRDGR